MTRMLSRAINPIMLCLLIGGTAGCGGPFVQGVLDLGNCREYMRQVDSVDAELWRDGELLREGSLAVVIAKDGTRASFKFNKKALAKSFGPGIQIDENRDALVIKYEKYINPMLIVFRDSAGQEIRDTITFAAHEFAPLNCQQIRNIQSEHYSDKSVRRMEEHYIKLHSAEKRVELHGSARKGVNLNIMLHKGTDKVDCPPPKKPGEVQEPDWVE